MMRNNTVQQLIDAKATIADKKHWVRGSVHTLSEDKDGHFYSRYCSIGALENVGAYAHYTHAWDVLRRNVGFHGLIAVAQWNDFAVSHRQVMAGFDRAITDAKCEALMIGRKRDRAPWLMRRAYRKIERERSRREARVERKLARRAFADRIAAIPRVDAITLRRPACPRPVEKVENEKVEVSA